MWFVLFQCTVAGGFQIIAALDLEKEVGESRQWQLYSCSIKDKDGLHDIFTHFNKVLLDNLETEIEKRKNNSPQHSNRV
jgi:hypothetical protein